jgi:SagB-type dehydrogenase family enzyme
MKTWTILILAAVAISASIAGLEVGAVAQETIQLPPPSTKGKVSLEETIAMRRSLRSFGDEGISLQEISQLLWAGQGTTTPNGKRRAAPSAGAIYPMTLYAFTKDGLYRYDPKSHALTQLDKKDLRKELVATLAGRRENAKAPLIVVIVADVNKTAAKYKDRATRYCDLEAGHIAQNMALQAEALKMGMVTIGAFRDEEIRSLLNLQKERRVCYVLPFGHR